MANQNFDFKKITEKLFSKSGTTILLIVGFVGIGLIFLSEFIPSGAKNTVLASQAVSAASSENTDNYAKNLENKLKSLVSSINGVGKSDIMITFGSSTQYVYEQDQKQTTDKSSQRQGDGGTQVTENNNQETQPVLISGDSGQRPLVKTELMPQVLGVVVVCDGGNNPQVQEDVVDAVSTALNLPSNHVCVIKKS